MFATRRTVITWIAFLALASGLGGSFAVVACGASPCVDYGDEVATCCEKDPDQAICDKVLLSEDDACEAALASFKCAVN